MKTNNIFKWTLALAIVIVLNLFFNFAIKLVYKAPVYENFCKVEQVNVPPDSKDSCLAVGGQWNESAEYYPKGQKMVPAPFTTPAGEYTSVYRGYCNVQFTCSKNYEDTSRVYNRNVFVALVVLGMLSMFAGYYAGENTPVSLGLSMGGVLSFIIGSIRYWSDMDDYLRVIILGLALISLIWLGIKKFSQNA
ncbi:MAG: hypothetical protein Q7S19_00720 [bacterium]|nr:hypothetical protein [bacterium]